MDDPIQLRQQILALQQRNGELENRLAQQADVSPLDNVLLRRVHEQLEQRFDQTLAERRLFIELVDQPGQCLRHRPGPASASDQPYCPTDIPTPARFLPQDRRSPG
ncbi:MULTISPECIES: DEK C-terminal domain-containing protein [unclassified Pseudomonas]|uniref:DEK C-terminal domain-containing protein n=1 Tax=unclassified Pseudomonas TaxID=196821 RepID=UPI0021096B58|nr:MULTISPECIES: DEK C-terminal domain-containing protein [unclassified Pseudomonas]